MPSISIRQPSHHSLNESLLTESLHLKGCHVVESNQVAMYLYVGQYIGQSALVALVLMCLSLADVSQSFLSLYLYSFFLLRCNWQ